MKLTYWLRNTIHNELSIFLILPFPAQDAGQRGVKGGEQRLRGGRPGPPPFAMEEPKRMPECWLWASTAIAGVHLAWLLYTVQRHANATTEFSPSAAAARVESTARWHLW